MEHDDCVCKKHETLEYRVTQLEKINEKRSDNRSKTAYLVYAQIIATIFMILSALFTNYNGGENESSRKSPRNRQFNSRGTFGGGGSTQNHDVRE